MLLIKHSSAMDSSSDDSSDSTDGSSDSSSNAIEWRSDDDEFDMMAVAMLVVLNNNIAITNLIAKQANHEQMINDVIAPNQHYRNKPRRPKALFYHHEALHCILRDYLGIPGDLTIPIFKDRNFEMMFRLLPTRV